MSHTSLNLGFLNHNGVVYSPQAMGKPTNPRKFHTTGIITGPNFWIAPNGECSYGAKTVYWNNPTSIHEPPTVTHPFIGDTYLVDTLGIHVWKHDYQRNTKAGRHAAIDLNCVMCTDTGAVFLNVYYAAAAIGVNSPKTAERIIANHASILQISMKDYMSTPEDLRFMPSLEDLEGLASLAEKGRYYGKLATLKELIALRHASPTPNQPTVYEPNQQQPIQQPNQPNPQLDPISHALFFDQAAWTDRYTSIQLGTNNTTNHIRNAHTALLKLLTKYEDPKLLNKQHSPKRLLNSLINTIDYNANPKRKIHPDIRDGKLQCKLAITDLILNLDELTREEVVAYAKQSADYKTQLDNPDNKPTDKPTDKPTKKELKEQQRLDVFAQIQTLINP